MTVLGKISSRFSIDAQEAPANKEEIKSLVEFSPINVPPDYLDIVSEATEVEINVAGEKHIRIWSPAGCVEMNESYEIQDYIPDSLAVGDDEGGNALIFFEGKDGFGLYIVGFGDLDAEEAVKVAPSLNDLLIYDTGIEKILEG
ncbi:MULTISPECIES: SMI1/KNR4 family protein [Bacillus]|uniref:SMI1/KNR4 family protein n=1 Tax=Bacillus glycinifermentans TaxID=1664069 RepID=A0AAJ4D3Q4_9BACI|nr:MULTISPECIES: SMI1/KNR4 family protein [Bacillus]KKB73051.1 SMI1/KNR4 family protein [Bacillus sp. TH008]MDU0070756.1 SMI1/KNR4 family protein [Bacillus sp. IG6]MED8018672.1 SMI1/KNR4 family protein [Bacillus glycinifermentans]QAT66177.1 SMI1/KNR4 family protein [Bacillus glycinifermentans]WKB75886.1 SMI1/KNR4 family protein [Bacillus glycinifermentans]